MCRSRENYSTSFRLKCKVQRVQVSEPPPWATQAPPLEIRLLRQVTGPIRTAISELSLSVIRSVIMAGMVQGLMDIRRGFLPTGFMGPRHTEAGPTLQTGTLSRRVTARWRGV